MSSPERIAATLIAASICVLLVMLGEPALIGTLLMAGAVAGTIIWLGTYQPPPVRSRHGRRAR